MADPIPFPDNATWFGPLDPLSPVALPGIAGRWLDYRPGQNLLVDARGDGSVPAPVLRALADDCDLVRFAIETRKDQFAALDRAIAPRAGAAGSQRSVAVIAKTLQELQNAANTNADGTDVHHIVEQGPGRPKFGDGLYQIPVILDRSP